MSVVQSTITQLLGLLIASHILIIIIIIIIICAINQLDSALIFTLIDTHYETLVLSSTKQGFNQH